MSGWSALETVTGKAGSKDVCNDQRHCCMGKTLLRGMAEEQGADFCNVKRCAAGHHAGPDAEGKTALSVDTVHLYNILSGRRGE